MENCPPPHTHAKKQQQLFIYSQFSDQTHQRESATVLQGQSGSPRGPRSLPVEIRQILAWDSSSWSSVCTQEAKIMTLGKQRCQVEYHAGFRARHKQNSDHDRMPDDYGFWFFTVRRQCYYSLGSFFKSSFIFCFQSIHNYGLTFNLWHRGNVQFTKVVYSKPLELVILGTRNGFSSNKQYYKWWWGLQSSPTKVFLTHNVIEAPDIYCENE